MSARMSNVFVRNQTSKMARLIASYDWRNTSLGPIETWPQSLLTITAFLIASPMPIVLLWGEDGVMIYNDAYSAFADQRHPQLLGSKVREGWPEVAEFNDNVMRVGLAGGTLAYTDQHLTLHRSGHPESVWMDLSYSPVTGDDGKPAGVIAIVAETTERVRAEKRLRFLDTLGQEIAGSTDASTILSLTTRLAGQHFGASVCAYADMDPDQDGFTIRGDWAAPAAKSIVGHYKLADFGALAVKQLGAGQPLVINDIAAELPPHEAATFQSIGVSATICMPLVKAGRLTALMAIHDRAPRRWNAAELLLIREVTERAWAHVERVGMEAELKASEENFETLARAMPNHVWTATPDGQLNWFNEQVYAYSGAELGTLDGANWARLVHPDDLPIAVERWSAALTSHETYETAFRLQRADSAWRWHITRAVPIKGIFGEVIKWIGTNTDIQDQKEVAETLANLNQTLERRVAERTHERDRAWQLSRDLQVVVLADGTIEATNPRWVDLLGWSAEQLIGKKFEGFVHPDDLESVWATFANILKEPLTIPFAYRFLHADGSYRWLAWTGVFEGDRIYAVGRDLSAERAQAEDLARIEEALRQSQKMEAVGQLTGGLAHDFNNLLTGMMGNIELLQMRAARGKYDDIERLVTAAQGAGRRAASLTQRLLAFSRRQTLDPVATDVNQLVAGMEELIRRTVGPSTDLEIVGSSGLWAVNIDPGQLENALLNLCINGRDAMPDGGRLTIETANKWLDDRAAKIHDLNPGQYVSLCVTDTGTGMSPDIIARAFEPFFTTKPIGQGTGLGLSMIYGFARQSGGQVRIYSEVGRGTTVCIYLPRHFGKAENNEPETAARELDLAAGQTVLIIDDEPTIRLLVDEVLDELGYKVVGAPDGPAGMKILQSAARIDLLITDVGLPNGLNGRQVADAARAVRPNLKVLFITGYAENAAVGNGHLEPGMDLLTKPFTMDALATKVASILKLS